MQREVEAFALHFVRDAQADHGIDDLEQDQGNDPAVDQHDHNALDLVDYLRGIALDQAGGAAVFGDREDTGQQRADDSAYAVDAEAVERIVSTQHAFQAGYAPVAEHAGSDANRHRADRSDEARSRRDRDETGNRAGADTDDSRLAAANPLDQHPGECRNRSGELRDRHRHARLHARGDGGAGIEPEPDDPQHRGADKGEHHVLRRTDILALAKAD